MCSLWFLCHGDCLGFSFGASIPVVEYGVAYFLLGAFQTFVLYGTSAIVRPCTTVDSVVNLLKAYIRKQPCQPAEKMAAVSHLPSPNSTFRWALANGALPGSPLVPWGPCLAALKPQYSQNASTHMLNYAEGWEEMRILHIRMQVENLVILPSVSLRSYVSSIGDVTIHNL